MVILITATATAAVAIDLIKEEIFIMIDRENKLFMLLKIDLLLIFANLFY